MAFAEGLGVIFSVILTLRYLLIGQLLSERETDVILGEPIYFST
jgi:hypothetical protein